MRPLFESSSEALSLLVEEEVAGFFRALTDCFADFYTINIPVRTLNKLKGAGNSDKRQPHQGSPQDKILTGRFININEVFININ